MEGGWGRGRREFTLTPRKGARTRNTTVYITLIIRKSSVWIGCEIILVLVIIYYFYILNLGLNKKFGKGMGMVHFHSWDGLVVRKLANLLGLHVVPTAHSHAPV